MRYVIGKVKGTGLMYEPPGGVPLVSIVSGHLFDGVMDYKEAVEKYNLEVLSVSKQYIMVKRL